MKDRSRTWGFQISLRDCLAIIVFASIAGMLWRWESPLWWIVVVAAGHFFLFCNVFRIIRRRELIWAGCFMFNVGAWAWLGDLEWSRVLLCQLPITALLIFADVRSPGYHGIFAKQLNAQLADYLEGKFPLGE